MNSNKPLVSFCILTYNQELYIEKALHSAFEQTYTPLEIIISDDFSQDRTRDKIKSIVTKYNGEHTIKLNFNDQNQGLASNFNKAVNMARGEFIVIAAGDDISLPNRTAISVNFMQKHPECFLADYHVDYIDENGTITPGRVKKENIAFRLEDLLNRKIKGVRGCSRIYRKKMFEIFDPLNSDCPTEDSPSVWRGIMLGNIWVLKDKAVLYRRHSTSISSPSNMYKLSINKIIRQYKKDIHKAFSLNLISENEYRNLLSTASKESRKRQYERVYKMIRKTAKMWKGNIFRLK